MNHEQFEGWCAKHGLTSNPEIATALNVSSQTIRNWRSGKRLPGWLAMACQAYDAHGADAITLVPKMSVAWFAEWQKRHDLATYEQTGAVFGLTRQAVHNWFRRGKFPSWIALACVGLDCAAAA